MHPLYSGMWLHFFHSSIIFFPQSSNEPTSSEAPNESFVWVLHSIKSWEQRSSRMLRVRSENKWTGCGKCGRIFPARSRSLPLGLVATVTSIKMRLKQSSTPSLDANSIQSRLADGLQFDSASRFNAGIPACGGQNERTAGAFVTVSTYERRLECPSLRGAAWKSHVLLWLLSLPQWQEAGWKGGPTQTCLQVSCVHQDVGL